MRIAITGATGYIGYHLCKRAASSGLDILALTRNKPMGQYEWQKYELYEGSVELPKDISVVIHLAMNVAVGDAQGLEREIQSAKVLLQAARNIKAKFVYLSSQTANESAASFYGRTKWHIEQLVLASGGVVIRPGLVYGGISSGLYGTLVKLVKASPVIPVFLPKPNVQPIHVGDLAEFIVHVCFHNASSDIYFYGSQQPVSMGDFLHAIAKNRFNSMRISIPIPQFFVFFLLKLFPTIPLLVRLKSLLTLHAGDPTSSTMLSRPKLKSLEDGVCRSSSNKTRRILIESAIFQRYVLSSKGSLFELRYFTRAILNSRNGRPLGFKRFLLFFPGLLGLLEKSITSTPGLSEEFQWRLNAMTYSLEFSANAKKAFVLSDKKIINFLVGFFDVGFSLVKEIAFLLGGRIFGGKLFGKFFQRVLMSSGGYGRT